MGQFFFLIHDFAEYNRHPRADCCSRNGRSYNGCGINAAVLAPVGNDIHRDQLDRRDINNQKSTHLISGGSPSSGLSRRFSGSPVPAPQTHSDSSFFRSFLPPHTGAGTFGKHYCTTLPPFGAIVFRCRTKDFEHLANRLQFGKNMLNSRENDCFFSGSKVYLITKSQTAYLCSFYIYLEKYP